MGSISVELIGGIVSKKCRSTEVRCCSPSFSPYPLLATSVFSSAKSLLLIRYTFHSSASPIYFFLATASVTFFTSGILMSRIIVLFRYLSFVDLQTAHVTSRLLLSLPDASLLSRRRFCFE